MVFVTVGNATQGFLRLLDAIDKLAGDGVLKDQEVFIQSGHNANFKPKHCRHQPFLSIEEFDKKIEACSLIICHGGCTQLQAIRLGKVPVVMPRRKKYGEHVNDHQVQLVQALACERLIIPAYESENLPEAIEKAGKLRQPVSFQTSNMLELVKNAIKELTRV